MLGLQRGLVQIVPYTADWAEQYKDEEMKFFSEIEAYAVDIQHIGSTSVPGLDAKPILDILIGLRNLADGITCIDNLKKLGYEYKGENGIPGRLFFSKGGGGVRTHHVHMVVWQGDLWKRHLLFRDYLRDNPEVARQYADLKRRLAVKYSNDRKMYTDSKMEFISNIIRLAEAKRDIDPGVV